MLKQREPLTETLIKPKLKKQCMVHPKSQTKHTVRQKHTFEYMTQIHTIHGRVKTYYNQVKIFKARYQMQTATPDKQRAASII